MKDPVERIVTGIRNSQILRLILVGVLVLVLHIPIAMINNLVREREGRQQAAIVEVSSKWGNAQSITGPALVVPYAHQWTETAASGQQISRSETRNAIFLPEQLRVRGRIDSEIRHRGIFSVPVYKADLTIDGEFLRPSFSELGIAESAVDWARAHVAVGISDARAIQEATTLSWNQQRVSFVPGMGGFKEGGTGIHAVVAALETMPKINFSFPLTLNGSMSLHMVPFGKNSVVEIEGDHGHPSFQGNWLPSTRTVSDSAFQANWAISYLGRSYPQAWTSEPQMRETLHASRFGVALIDPVDHYRMTERSVKYAGLFILLTFATVWLIELLGGIRVHTIQYLLLGAALCLFYLLELSLSEHLGFPVAYTVASAAVVGLVAFYSVGVLGQVRHASIVAAGVTLLYGYLYVLLMSEDYALLIGSIGLFAILAAIMFVTRRVDWYTVGSGGST